ncbi:uncharacterized protein V6R79_006003 [Siganus canaliculatus]
MQNAVHKMQMEASSSSRACRGLWKNPGATQYSKETKEMLRLMMQESRLTHLQRKQINNCIESGSSLPLTSCSTSPSSPPQTKTKKCARVVLSGRPQKRSAEACRSKNSYVREKFLPGPTRDLEKEKRKLQNIFATGQEEPTEASVPDSSACQKPEVEQEIDRYEEVLSEIAERRQFLADMASVGKDRMYISIINTEISQKMSELKMLDKKRGPKKETVATDETT